MPRSSNRTMSRLRLQRRHYQFIAEAIRNYRLLNEPQADLAFWFATQLQGTNSDFDRGRFIAACGPEPAPEPPRCLLCQSENR